MKWKKQLSKANLCRSENQKYILCFILNILLFLVYFCNFLNLSIFIFKEPTRYELERFSEEDWNFTPLPTTTRSVGDHRGKSFFLWNICKSVKYFLYRNLFKFQSVQFQVLIRHTGFGTPIKNQKVIGLSLTTTCNLEYCNNFNYLFFTLCSSNWHFHLISEIKFSDYIKEYLFRIL